MIGDLPPKPGILVQPVGSIRRRDRVPSQYHAVLADKPVLQTGRVRHRRVEAKEAARRRRDLDDIFERSVATNAAAAAAAERPRKQARRPERRKSRSTEQPGYPSRAC